MHKKGHLGAALLAYAPIGFLVTLFGTVEVGALGAAVAATLSMVPDWDQRVPLVEHRGITHTVHFAVLVGIIIGVGGLYLALPGGTVPGIGAAVLGFTLGLVTILSHIGADALTPMGVDPFRDGERRSYDVVRAANPLANYVLFVLGTGAATAAVIAASGLRETLL